MLSVDQLTQLLKKHLGLQNPIDGISQATKWIVAESPLGGRGLFVTEDVKPGEVLFVDRPLIYGPRSAANIQRGCTVCGKLNSDTFFNCHICALLLCSEKCQDNDIHYTDCAIISRWNAKVPLEEVDDTLLSQALAAIRALGLNEEQRRLMTSLAAHFLPQHGVEVRKLKEYFDIQDEEEEIMSHACCVLDANSYQIATPYGMKEMSQRGLYPVSALMNHNCVPNTRHSYNSDLQMTVKAVKSIPAGTELFTSYSGLLWGTPARRTHLHKTKHFFCMCDRCADPTERGTYLAALKCFSSECPGSLLPIDPLKLSCSWRCLDCGMRVPSKNIAAIQSALGSLMGSLDFKSIDELENFLVNRMEKFIPRTNQIFVDLQCQMIWEIGEVDGLRWQELSESRLALKESLCRGILRILAALGVGDAHLRGLLLYHLHAVLAERARRYPQLYEELRSEIESTIVQAYSILHGDISSPPDLELRYRYLGPGCDNTHQEKFCILNA